jgi:hypothetical protein
MSLPGYAATEYQLWDGLKNQACVCDPGYNGVDCSQRRCPHGADPLHDRVPNANNNAWIALVDEIQSIAVEGAGSLVLEFKDVFGETWRTEPILLNVAVTSGANSDNLVAALKGIPNSVIEDVVVTESVNTNVLTLSVTFTKNPGDIPELSVYDKGALTDADVSEAVKGTKVASECSGRGLCDYETGLCKCFRGYRLANCSNQHALAFGSTTTV